MYFGRGNKRSSSQQQIEQARAEAESYRLKNQEITQETLAMEWINKWDGKLPSVASDGSMMFDISDIIAAAGSGKSASAEIYNDMVERETLTFVYGYGPSQTHGILDERA